MIFTNQLPMIRHNCLIKKISAYCLAIIGRLAAISRNIIGRLLAISIHNGKCVDFERAMKYCLAPVPLYICNLDGAMRKTSKSVLMKEILTNFDTIMQPDSHVNSTVYIIHCKGNMHFVLSK